MRLPGQETERRPKMSERRQNWAKFLHWEDSLSLVNKKIKSLSPLHPIQLSIPFQFQPTKKGNLLRWTFLLLKLGLTWWWWPFPRQGGRHPPHRPPSPWPPHLYTRNSPHLQDAPGKIFYFPHGQIVRMQKSDPPGEGPWKTILEAPPSCLWLNPAEHLISSESVELVSSSTRITIFEKEIILRAPKMLKSKGRGTILSVAKCWMKYDHPIDDGNKIK